MVYLLLNILNGKGLTKTEKSKLGYIIQNLAFELAHLHGLEDFKFLHDTFAEVSYDEQAAEAESDLKVELAKMFKSFGFEPDMSDWDFDNPMEIAAKMAKKRYGFAEAMNAKSKNDRIKKQVKKNKKKTPEQLAKDAEKLAEKEQAEQETKKSIKEIYNQLVKAFHPDKEMDIEKKAQKTEIMKQITVAYNDNDLFTLLKLQIELEMIDDDKLAELSEAKIKNFISVLNEQISKLNSEIDATKQSALIFDKYEDWTVILKKTHDYQQALKSRAKEINKHIKEIELI
jgi:hypothetical protein